jgi:hypothetical protein
VGLCLEMSANWCVKVLRFASSMFRRGTSLPAGARRDVLDELWLGLAKRDEHIISTFAADSIFEASARHDSILFVLRHDPRQGLCGSCYWTMLYARQQLQIFSWDEIAMDTRHSRIGESKDFIFELSVGIATCRIPFKGSVYSV